MSADAGGHPDRLLWYAGGRLDAESAGLVERHLAACPDCRREVDALRSMFRTIRAQAKLDHVPSADLLAYRDGGRALSDADARLIAEHVGECRECAEDLALLGRAARTERRIRSESAEGGTKPPLPAWRRAAVGAAAALVVVSVAAWGLSRREAPPPSVAAASRVVFAPSLRGLVAERRLAGPGPWEIEVLPPVLAAETSYTARIRRADGPAELLFQGRFSAAPGGSVVLRGVELPETGRYVLELAPTRDDGPEVQMYAFDVVRPR